MAEKKLGTFEINPAKNPAVLDTLTWDTPALLRRLQAQSQDFWRSTRLNLCSGKPLPEAHGLRLYEHSRGQSDKRSFVLLEDQQGQCAVAEFTPSENQPSVPDPLLRRELEPGESVFFHEANAKTLHSIYGRAAPEKVPQALAMTPRLGIGTRMSQAMWPGIWQALREGSFSANAFQNSLRELNLLENIRERRAGNKLYYPGIGFVPEGHTGSTFEGLWLSGVVGGLKAGVTRPYGADADHIMVKRGVDGLERAKRVLTAARYYSFFTIDVSDILDYAAFPGAGSGKASVELLQQRIGDAGTRKEVLAYYRKPLKIGGRSYRLGESELSALVGKYWQAMEAMDVLIPFIQGMRGNEPFDLELSIDEHPPEIHPFDCLTVELEVAFILNEMKRRGKRLSHIAPNLGVEKHVDYRYRDGLEGLEARTRALHRLANEEEVVIDCHSGDDLSSSTRRALKRATGGLLNFKVSPFPQTLFADVLYAFDRDFFRIWWEDTYAFAQENATEGSVFAAECLKQFDTDPAAAPHPRYSLFRIYCYATVGKRDERGDYLYRERFYALSPEFYAEYTRQLKSYLCLLADDLLP
ncbi:MAG: tagaturonate epimerase family protein [Spirochaetia bacterium]|jgi:hypothetical protein